MPSSRFAFVVVALVLAGGCAMTSTVRVETEPPGMQVTNASGVEPETCVSPCDVVDAQELSTSSGSVQLRIEDPAAGSTTEPITLTVQRGVLQPGWTLQMVTFICGVGVVFGGGCLATGLLATSVVLSPLIAIPGVNLCAGACMLCSFTLAGGAITELPCALWWRRGRGSARPSG